MGSYIWDKETGELVAVLSAPLTFIGIGSCKAVDNDDIHIPSYNILTLTKEDCKELRAYLTSVKYDEILEEYEGIWKKDNTHEEAKAETEQFYIRNPSYGIFFMINEILRFMEERPETLNFDFYEEWA